MKLIKIAGCFNCPFLQSDYDDYAVGHSSLDKCVFQQFLDVGDYYISVHDNLGPDPEAETPDWCPLKKESFSFEFKEFDEDTKKQLSRLQEEIESTQQDLDKLTSNSAYDIEIAEDLSLVIQQLCNQLNNLQRNQSCD